MLSTLFIVFLKIGAFAFGGGYAVLPLIERFVITQQHWLSYKELTDLISLSQMTPGPIAINSATFIGTKVAGFPGALVATIGNVIPQFILMMVLGYFLFGGKPLRFLNKMLKGLKPAIVGLIAIAALSMVQSSLFTGGVWSWTDWSVNGVIGLMIGFFLYGKKKKDLLSTIAVSAVVGIVTYGIGYLWF